MSTTRRNGLLSSCEPCRISKVRCDHSLPVCQRCVARRRPTECVYHPCPLTKRRQNRNLHTGNDVGNHSDRENTSRHNTASPPSELFDWVLKSSSVQARRFGPSQATDDNELFARLGYLGPTNDTRVFSDQLSNTRSESASRSDTIVEEIDSTEVETGAQILSLLVHVPFFADVLEKRFDLFDGWIFGPPLVRETLTRLRELYHSIVQGSSAVDRYPRLLEWSRLIFRNTAATIETNATTTLSEYILQIAPKWETIGLIFALLGTATYQINPDDAVLRRDGIPGNDKQGLRKIAIAVSGMCLQFCNKVSVMSEPWCWAAIHHTVFMIEMHGSNDYRTWRSLGDVINLVFALGLHQRKVDERAPFFLSEIRSRTIIAAYYMDKELATFLGRPPRICRQYCDFQTPLDLSWEDLVADASIQEAAVRQLDSNGWNMQGDLDKGARPRVTLLTSIIREMILELSLSPHVDNLEDIVKSVFAKRTREIPDSLIVTASEILRLLLDLVSKQVQAGRINRLITFDLSYIGLPAAAVLSKELLRRSQLSADQSILEIPFPRSEVIQRLSVFVVQVESFFPSREGDYDTCMKGLSFIRQVLDSVLSPSALSAQLSNEIRQEESGLIMDMDMDFATFLESFDWEQEMRPVFT
ncbi:putative Zn(II)2Cys6 transcription factor [Aspergillus desertorum]